MPATPADNLNASIEILERTPATLQALLQGLSDEWVTPNEGGESWSAYDIVGHLLHGERTDWIARAKIILDQGESRTFSPFDRTAMFIESKARQWGSSSKSLRGVGRTTLRF